jgi:hypothetical protein
MHQALKARDDAQHAEEAQQEAEARVDEQLRRERDMHDRKRRLADVRTALPDPVLEALRRRAEEALAVEGVERTRLGYDMLVKLKVDELLEREYLSEPMRDDRSAPDRGVVASGTR